MRILYIDKIKKTCNYYKDIVVALKLDHDVLVVNDNKDLVNKINKFKADIIIIGFGVSSGEKKGFLKINLEVDIPTYVILNKEYTQLKEKLDWIKSIKPPVKKVFSVHHDVLKYQEYCNIPFTRIIAFSVDIPDTLDLFCSRLNSVLVALNSEEILSKI